MRSRVIIQFLMTLGIAFLGTVFVTVMIYLNKGMSTVPMIELRNDAIWAVFVAVVQLIWVGSEKDNKTYIRRTIINFAVLVGGFTLLMLLFGWMPPFGWPIVLCYVLFVAIYALIWAVIWRYNNKKREQMNQKLQEYKNEV